MFEWEIISKQEFGASLSENLFKPTKKIAPNQWLYN